ncbi:uncharacterized protein LOC143231091 isoform X5 [Tachypleus tridentatus]|uniref:uncharacterized protein LOC143231091 isoform X5 n=1 Tax=Tachypleus tridentatus TaxID=6853 RepID=UPI003FD154ED
MRKHEDTGKLCCNNKGSLERWKDMTVGESSPIPLKPTLARALSARSRHQRPPTRQNDQVLGALWKMVEPQYSVRSRRTSENDPEAEELDTRLTPYDKTQSEQNRGSTSLNGSNRLPSVSSMRDENITSDRKRLSSVTDAIFSGKPVLIRRSPSHRRLKQGNNRARTENRANGELPSKETKGIMGNSEPTSKPAYDDDSFASHNGPKIKVVGTASSDITLSPSSTSTTRRRKKHPPERVSSSQSLPSKTKKASSLPSASISERGNTGNSGVSSNSSDSLANALKRITSEDWLQKIDAMNEFNRLAVYQPKLLQPELHSVVLVLLPEIRNLRSSVSRAAINTFGILFQKFPRRMEADLDLITKTLLHKSGESVGFIREDVWKTLKHLVDGVLPQKAALAIVDGGASHRNATVRGATAEFLSMTVEKLGPSRCLRGCKDVAEKVIPATAQFVIDRSPLARFYGRTIFGMLMEHSDFERILQKNLSTTTILHIRNVLDSIKKKGVGERPEEGISFKSTKSDPSTIRSVRTKKLT